MAVIAGVGRLAPPVDINGPRVRLGLAWAAITFTAVAIGPVATSSVYATVALGAAGQACRTWRRSGHRPYLPVAAGGAAACALAGSVGPLPVVIVAALVTSLGLAATRLRLGGTAWDARVTLAIALGVGIAAASPALVRRELGALPALVLVALIHAVDASAFIVGSGARSRWEGPVAGLATAGAMGLAVAATMVPPFPRSQPLDPGRGGRRRRAGRGRDGHRPPRTRRGAGACAPAPRCLSHRRPRLGPAGDGPLGYLTAAQGSQT